MTKADAFLREHGGEVVCLPTGEVAVADDIDLQVIGMISRIELTIEYPEELIGVYRVEHVMLYDQEDQALYDDQTVVENVNFYSEEQLVSWLARHYGVSADIIDMI